MAERKATAGYNNNHVRFVGFAGKDAELRHTPAGQSVAQFSLAINANYRSKDGNVVEVPAIWLQVTAWGFLADDVAGTIRTGDRVIVEGKLKIDFRDGEGKACASGDATRTYVSVTADYVSKPVFKARSGGNDFPDPVDDGAHSQGGGRPMDEEDIPF